MPPTATLDEITEEQSTHPADENLGGFDFSAIDEAFASEDASEEGPPKPAPKAAPTDEPEKPESRGLQESFEDESEEPEKSPKKTESDDVDQDALREELIERAKKLGLVDEDDESPWWLEEKQGSAFGKVKGENKQLRSQIEELEANLESLKDRPDGESIKALEEQNQELQKKLAAYDITETDEYQQEVAEPLDQLVQQLKSYEIDGLVEAMDIASPRERARAIAEALEEADSEFLANGVAQIATQIDSLVQKRDRMRAKAPELLEQLRKDQELKTEKSKAEIKREFEKAHETAREKYQKLFPEIVGEDGDINKDYREKLELAMQQDLAEAKPTTRAAAAQWYAMGPKLVDSLRGQIKELEASKKELEETVSGLSTSGGSAGGRGGSSPSGSSGKSKSYGFMEEFDELDTKGALTGFPG